MIYWKEWRENRFGFLTALFFVSGLYYSLPPRHTLLDEYWLGVFLVFFGIAMAVVMGASAVASEVGADTTAFLLSKPAPRLKFLLAKYLVRAAEMVLIFITPIFFLALKSWDNRTPWMWTPPYLVQQYLLHCVALIVFIYSGAFFFSVLIRKQALCALAGIGLVALYFALRGMSVLHKVYELERVETEIYLLVLLSVVAFAGSILAFKLKEF